MKTFNWLASLPLLPRYSPAPVLPVLLQPIPPKTKTVVTTTIERVVPNWIIFAVVTRYRDLFYNDLPVRKFSLGNHQWIATLTPEGFMVHGWNLLLDNPTLPDIWPDQHSSFSSGHNGEDEPSEFKAIGLRAGLEFILLPNGVRQWHERKITKTKRRVRLTNPVATD